jgi:hypothetical protein
MYPPPGWAVRSATMIVYNIECIVRKDVTLRPEASRDVIQTRAGEGVVVLFLEPRSASTPSEATP